MSELKPCPNPECTNPRWTEYLPNDGWVECECGVTGPSPSEEKIGRRGDVRKEAVRLWNLLPSTNWVSVDERLPELERVVLLEVRGKWHKAKLSRMKAIKHTTWVGVDDDSLWWAVGTATAWLDNLPPIPTGNSHD